MSRVWVGGATGFLGQELVRQLVARGQHVVAVSQSGGPIAGVNPEALTVRSVDATDVAQVKDSAQGCELAYFAVGRVSRDPDAGAELHRAHVVASMASLDGLRQAGVKRVVVVSTSGTIACGTDPDRTYSELDPTPHEVIARWPYYRSKLFAERAALERNEPGVFDVVVVNPSLLLGPGDRRASSTLDVRRFLSGLLPALPRGGIALVDVRDVALGMIAAGERGRAGERYLLSAANVSCVVFFERLGRLSGRPVPALRLPKRPAFALASHWAYKKALELVGGNTDIELSSVEMGSYFWYCDCSKAERELGWSPRDAQVTLRDTVTDILGESGRGARS
jgi:dihydroflavonol-4-reductase